MEHVRDMLRNTEGPVRPSVYLIRVLETEK